MDAVSYILSRKYTEDTAIGLGAVRGKPCNIQSITPTDDGNRVTFRWTGDDGTVQTSAMLVKNGIDGESIVSIEIDTNNRLKCTLTDGTVIVTNPLDLSAEKIDYTNAEVSGVSNVQQALDKLFEGGGATGGGASGSFDIQNFYYDSVNKCVRIVTSSGSFSANIPEELNDADLINKITLDATHGTLLYDGNPISGFTQAQMNLLNKLGENASGELMFDGKEVNVMTPVEKENLDKIVNNVIVTEDPTTGDVTVELGELILEAKKDAIGNVEGLLVNGMDVLIQETSAPDTSLDDEYGNLNWQ